MRAVLLASGRQSGGWRWLCWSRSVWRASLTQVLQRSARASLPTRFISPGSTTRVRSRARPCHCRHHSPTAVPQIEPRSMIRPTRSSILLVLGSRNRKKCREMAELIAPPWEPSRRLDRLEIGTLDEFPDAPEVDESAETF